MDEQLRIILIIIVSVSIFGLLVFVFVKNYLKSRINQMVKKIKKINQSSLIIFVYSSLSISIILLEVSKSKPFLARSEISFL